jgi:NAD(P)-dependent dehydrogenase (short-subunit alcohol dehydrogenase family)
MGEVARPATCVVERRKVTALPPLARLNGRTTIVAGASRGQGAAEARRFVEEGAHVVIADVLVSEGKQLVRAAGGGSIINVASAAGLTGLAGRAAYGASKWALRGMSRTAAIGLGRDLIRVNTIFPGPIDKDMIRTAEFDPQNETAFQNLPLRRRGGVDEVAALAVFLASDESSYISGAETAVDGGMTVGLSPTLRTT